MITLCILFLVLVSAVFRFVIFPPLLAIVGIEPDAFSCQVLYLFYCVLARFVVCPEKPNFLLVEHLPTYHAQGPQLNPQSWGEKKNSNMLSLPLIMLDIYLVIFAWFCFGFFLVFVAGDQT